MQWNKARVRERAKTKNVLLVENFIKGSAELTKIIDVLNVQNFEKGRTRLYIIRTPSAGTSTQRRYLLT